MNSKIEKVVEKYNQFQQNRGKKASLDSSSIIQKIFSDNFKKVANGKEIVSTREGLEKQLAGAKEILGSWNIEVKYLIPSACDTKCTLRYTLQSAKAGDFDVLAVISSENGAQIDAIDEIYIPMDLAN